MNRHRYLTAGFLSTLRPKEALAGVVWRGFLAGGLLALAACGDGGPPAAKSAGVDFEVRVTDVTELPIEGASITIVAAGVTHQRTTRANGIAEFSDLPTGEATISVSAADFEPWASDGLSLDATSRGFSLALRATGAWAVGRPIVLGTRMVDLASDGSAMTFSLDVAVVGANSEALETLTSDDFSVETVDCGWYLCATDAAGNETGNFSPDGGAQAFGLQPPSARNPYLVGVLAERSAAVTDWGERAPALKSFFTALGGNDTASLASVQTENGSASLTVLGPFTSDGSIYLDAIDQLAQPAGDPPVLLDSLTDSIHRAAAANSAAIPGTEATVVVLATSPMTIPEIDTAAALARQLGVRISTVVWAYLGYGLPEIAVRTGGFVAGFADPRQLGMVFGAMDGLLAGTMPYYRMQFRLKGDAGTFVSGGNAKIVLRLRVPTPLPSDGEYFSLNMPIL